MTRRLRFYPILSPSKVEQLDDNLASLDVSLSPDQLLALDAPSAPDPVHPYPIFTPAVNRAVFGGATVQGWH